MKILLIMNIIALALCSVVSTYCFAKYLNAEIKLAKHDESEIFLRK